MHLLEFPRTRCSRAVARAAQVVENTRSARALANFSHPRFGRRVDRSPLAARGSEEPRHRPKTPRATGEESGLSVLVQVIANVARALQRNLAPVFLHAGARQ